MINTINSTLGQGLAQMQIEVSTQIEMEVDIEKGKIMPLNQANVKKVLCQLGKRRIQKDKQILEIVSLKIEGILNGMAIAA